MDDMAKQYDLEQDRKEALVKALQDVLPDDLTISTTELRGCVTGGSVLISHQFLAANLELKHSGDPELQNLAYMLRANVQGDGRMRAALCELEPRAPCFLLDVHSGVVMTVRGAVICSPCVISEPLATVSLVGRRHSGAHVTLARVLAALRDGINALALRYRRVRAAEERLASAPRIPATPGSVGGMRTMPLSIPQWRNDGAPPLFVRLGEQLARHRLVFAAIFVWPDGSPRDGCPMCPERAGACRCAAVVKLARGQYGAEAHYAAAEASAAPRLLGVDPHLPGGWAAVLMEHLREGDGWVRASDTACDEAVQAACAAAYTRAIADHGNVHGDLRGCNVLIRRARCSEGTAAGGGSGGGGGGGGGAPDGGAGSGASAPAEPVSVAFIDWDWAGREGEARYPLGLNPEVDWPEGVAGGAPIIAAHDVTLLRRVL